MKPVLRSALRQVSGSALVVAAGLAVVLGLRWPAGTPVATDVLLRTLLRPAVGAWVLLLVVLTTVAWRLTLALARARVKPSRDRAGDSGTAVIEFAMLFPILMMVMLIIVQLSLLMQGNLIVNYATYAAVRSAVVQIPQDVDMFGEARNELDDDPDAPKMSRIRRAAVLALTPVSGHLPSSGDSRDIQRDLRSVYAGMGQDARAGLNVAFSEKFAYADERTRIMDVGRRQDDGTFDPHQEVRVVLQHDLELGVPFARAIFADGTFQDSVGRTHYYTTVEAHYRLTNEGPRPEPLEPFCPLPPPPPPRPPSNWNPPPSGCPYH